jgi:hypothetical protein
MKDFVTCGSLKIGNGFSDIVCDPATGDLIFCDDINGNCVMSNMSITDPINTEYSPAVDKIIESTGADGVIMSETYLIILKDFEAEYRDYTDPMQVLHKVSFDIDIVYEGEIE